MRQVFKKVVLYFSFALLVSNFLVTGIAKAAGGNDFDVAKFSAWAQEFRAGKTFMGAARWKSFADLLKSTSKEPTKIAWIHAFVAEFASVPETDQKLQKRITAEMKKLPKAYRFIMRGSMEEHPQWKGKIPQLGEKFRKKAIDHKAFFSQHAHIDPKHQESTAVGSLSTKSPIMSLTEEQSEPTTEEQREPAEVTHGKASTMKPRFSQAAKGSDLAVNSVVAKSPISKGSVVTHTSVMGPSAKVSGSLSKTMVSIEPNSTNGSPISTTSSNFYEQNQSAIWIFSAITAVVVAYGVYGIFKYKQKIAKPSENTPSQAP